jgi:hypothetical protein
MPNSGSDIWGDIVSSIKSIPSGAEHDLGAVVNAAKGSPAALVHILTTLNSATGGLGPFNPAGGINALINAKDSSQTSSLPYSTTPNAYGSSPEDTFHGYGGDPKKAAAAPTTSLFNLQAAMQPYEQPYENMMDTLLGSKPGQAPTVAQAEKSGMSMLGPYLQGLPQGLAQTITAAARPEFAAAAGLPTAVNASVQTAPYAGLLTDLIAAAKNQLVYGAGIGTPLPPGALGALQQDVTQAGSGISGLGSTLGLTPAPAQTTTPAATSIPGG